MSGPSGRKCGQMGSLKHMGSVQDEGTFQTKVESVLGTGDNGVCSCAGGHGVPVGFSRLCPKGLGHSKGFNLLSLDNYLLSYG